MPQVPSTDWDKQWSKLIARAWADEAFKRRLLASPAAVLQEYGLLVPPGVQVKIMENTAQVLHLMLPPRPVGELTEDELEQVAAGYGCETNPAILAQSVRRMLVWACSPDQAARAQAVNSPGQETTPHGSTQQTV